MRTLSDCHHHWRIESPNGPTSHGVCLRCGAEREFLNSGAPERSLTNAERAAIARTRAEEAAIREIIAKLGGDGTLPLTSYRRNLRDEAA